MIMTETVRLRLVFEDQHLLSKSKKKEELQLSWCLLKPQTNTISDVASYIIDTFRLHRTCPDGIILSMDGFVLPPFESRAILKDKDIVCVKRKGSTSTASEATMLTSAPGGHQHVELPKLLANEMFQEVTGGYKTISEEPFKDTLHLESKSPNDAVSKKRKATKKLTDSRKKIKLSSYEKLAVTPEEPVAVENNGSFQGCRIHCLSSLVNKDNGKSSNLSSQPDKSKTIDNKKQSNGISEPMTNEARSCQPEDGGKGKVDISNSLSGTKKVPTRSARRKKAQRQWLRERLKLEKEKLHQSPLSEKNVQELPVKDNKSITSNVHQEPVEESDAEDDVVAVEIKPGHIRFEPLSKIADHAAPQNQFPMETFRWNGSTNKKKMQKWGIEKTSFHKVDHYKHSSQECSRIQNAEDKEALVPIDSDKLVSYTGLPKEGDVIAYRLIELSSSWTPEISSFRVGKISWYDPEPNRIRLEPVLEYPLDFGKKVDEEVSSLQPESSPYGEDGSLEIDYSSLVDVRMIKHGNTELANAVTSGDVLADPTKATKRRGDELISDQTAMQSCHSHKESDGPMPAKENRELNVWDEINEALTAKKAKLSLENGWTKEQNSGSRSWSQRSLRCSALGPTVALLRAQNELGETSQQ